MRIYDSILNNGNIIEWLIFKEVLYTSFGHDHKVVICVIVFMGWKEILGGPVNWIENMCHVAENI